MVENNQPDWRTLAAEQFPGFPITGSGPFAVPSAGSTLLVELFEHELIARNRALEIGAKMVELTPPATRPRFKRIRMDE